MAGGPDSAPVAMSMATTRRLLRLSLLGLTLPGVRRALSPLRSGIGTIFMLHRLAEPGPAIGGSDPAELRRTLAFLRRRGHRLVSLPEMLRQLEAGAPGAELGTAFTLDDGYAEQVAVAGPIFAEFDCPATVFVTTGFLDGTLWQWWDKIEVVLQRTRARRVTVEIGGGSHAYDLGSDAERRSAQDDFTARCKRVPDHAKHQAIRALAEAAGVDLPERPPEGYAPMTWDALRAWERRGLSFGPHTVTHPILSQTETDQCRAEILGSWERLREHAAEPVPVFCYPNGGPEDVGVREHTIVREAGFAAALTTSVGYASVPEFRARPGNRFLLRRYPYPEDHRIAALYVSGADRLRRGLGEGAPAGR